MTTLSGKTYLVGGAVRDAILGLTVRDRDFVVVGSNVEEMTSAGFKQVGKDFPVFLHPHTSEEYALARAEKKVGPGYRGFEVVANSDVTLEQDLARRDLTINAIAQDESGQIYDPFEGVADLKHGCLRHVSPAFSEDPVRILRVARFMARYGDQGFFVAPETMDLMRSMVSSGEVDHLVPERVWGEFVKACTEPRPSLFLSTLRECGALARILPEVDALYGVPQVESHHPEVDTGIHTEMVLDMAVRLAPGNSRVAFAALTHDLGKALTPGDVLPKHLGHEEAGLVPLSGLIDRWRVPTEHAALARAVCKHHLVSHQAFEVRTGTIMDLLNNVDAWRHPSRWEEFILTCEADKRGRLGRFENAYPQADHLRAVRVAATSVSTAPLIEKGFSGPALGKALRDAQIRAIHEVHGPMRRPAPQVKACPPRTPR
jgi:tRNA nucleotidyltransferase (CCA-adding enzyme)